MFNQVQWTCKIGLEEPRNTSFHHRGEDGSWSKISLQMTQGGSSYMGRRIDLGLSTSFVPEVGVEPTRGIARNHTLQVNMY